MSNTITEKEVKEAIKGKLSRYFGVSPTEATEEQMYKAVVMSVRDILLENLKKGRYGPPEIFNEHPKQKFIRKR